MSSYIGTFFMWNQISACFIFGTWLTWKTVSISQCNLPGSCVLSDGTYRYWTGKCYLSSRFHLKLISRIYLRKCCTCLRRLAASQRPLSKAGKTVMERNHSGIWKPIEIRVLMATRERFYWLHCTVAPDADWALPDRRLVLHQIGRNSSGVCVDCHQPPFRWITNDCHLAMVDDVTRPNMANTEYSLIILSQLDPDVMTEKCSFRAGPRGPLSPPDGTSWSWPCGSERALIIPDFLRMKIGHYYR
jgi:hypothetical protein